MRPLSSHYPDSPVHSTDQLNWYFIATYPPSPCPLPRGGGEGIPFPDPSGGEEILFPLPARERARVRVGQLAAHWMISSALTSSDRGIVSPRALAVLRLITSSNFVACCTGRSAGLA